MIGRQALQFWLGTGMGTGLFGAFIATNTPDRTGALILAGLCLVVAMVVMAAGDDC